MAGLLSFVGMVVCVAAVALCAASSAFANPHTGFSPMTNQCMACHQLHSSPSTDSILIKQNQKTLCYYCHDGTQSAYNVQAEFGESGPGTSTAVSHHPVPEGALQCSDCHTPHKGPLEGNPMSLSAGSSKETTGNAVCGTCHGATTTLPEGDVASKFTGTAHDVSMTLAATGGSSVKCLGCHEPHGSSNTDLISASIKSISGVTRTVSVTATSGATSLCMGCHDMQDGNYAGPAGYAASRHYSVTTSTLAAVVYPGSGAKASDCENCHGPHGTGQPHMLRASGDTQCYGCHDATGTVKPSNYSYQGQTRYASSAHSAIVGADVPGYVSLSATSTGFAAYESTATPPTPSSPGAPMSADKIARLGSLDASYAVTSLANATGQHDYQVYRFKSPVAGSGAYWVAPKWSGYGEELAGYETSVSVWSVGGNKWIRLANGVMADRTTVTSTSPNPTDVVDSNGYIWLMADAKKVIQSAITVTPTVQSADSTHAVITWTTAGYASSWVDFGQTSAYGSTVGTDTRTTSHSVTIPLGGALTYHMRARSIAREGDSASSADLLFNTTPPVLNASLNQAGFQQSFVETFTWSMNDPPGQPYTYDIHIWADPAYYPYDQTTTGLTSAAATRTLSVYTYWSAPYHWQVRGRDKNGAYTPWSAVGNFTLTDQTVYSPGGSCPFLYVWDGNLNTFQADLNTAGMIGSKNTSGYIKPDSRDRFVLTAPPASKDGQLEMRLVEERREVDYTDEFKLYTVDLPDGYDLYAEKGERGGTSPIPPAGLHTVQDLRTPLSVVRTDTGEDVTGLVRSVDDQRVQLNTDPNVDFNYQTLELDLGDVSSAPQVKVVMNAQTLRPFSADGLARQRSFGATTKLEVQNLDGTWRSVPASEATLPNAMEFPRSYIFDITKAMHDTTGKVRFTFLFQTWINMIGFDTSQDLPVTMTEVPMTDATLSYHGVDGRSNNTNFYQYVYGSNVTSGTPFPGSYTRYGDVMPLLADTDDKFVVYGQGDQLLMHFQPPAPGPDGTHRSYLTYTDGYYKSVKSAVPFVVAPLPFAAMSNYPYSDSESYPTDADHQAYLTDYNTRVVADPADPAATSTATAQSSPITAAATFFGSAVSAVQGVVVSVGRALGLVSAPAVPTASAQAASAQAVTVAEQGAAGVSASVPDQRVAKLHRSLNVDQVTVGISTRSGGSASGCVACHAVHGGGIPNADGTTPKGALVAPESSSCLDFGNGGCHDKASNSAGLVDVNARLTAGAAASTHHDVLPAAQAASGGKVNCSDCHDPHTNNAGARYSDADNISASIATSLGAYVNPNGRMYLLVGAMHDATPPTITVGPSITGTASASTILTPTVTWTTTEPASSWVDFGLTSGGPYSSSFGTATPTTSHSVVGTGLLPNKLYYWRVRTADAMGNLRTSAEATYSTTAQGATFTSGPTLTGNGWANYLTPSVAWTTSDQFSTKLEWGTTSGVYTGSWSSSTLATGHAAAMSGLSTDTVYYWHATGTDAIGRTIASTEATYKASPPPIPVILGSAVASGTTWSTYATPTVSWTTSDFTTSWVQWGTTSGGPYPKSAGDNGQATSHTVQVPGLSASTTYYFKVFGFDPVGRLVMSGEYAYTTTPPAVPIITAGPAISGATYSTANTPTVTWTSSDIMSSWVDWGTSPGSYVASAGVGTMATGHSVTLGGLNYGSTYYWRVRGVDLGGHLITSAEYSYTPSAYPAPVTTLSESPNPAYYDSSVQAGAAVSISCSSTTIASAHALEYQLQLNGSAYGAWQSGTTWNLTLAANSWTARVLVRDASLPSLTTLSAGSNAFDVTDTYDPNSSCPDLYAWDGSAYNYVTDVMGLGSLGLRPAPGAPRYPIPAEDSRIDPSMLQAQDGVYKLVLRENRKELDYIDKLTLKVIDHPAGTKVYLSDFAGAYASTNATELPPNEPHTVSDVKPIAGATYTNIPLFRGAAVTDQDITSQVATEDGVFAPASVFDDGRYVFDLGHLDDPAAVKIVMTGWTQYATPTEKAQWRALGKDVAPHTLEVMDADGNWVPLYNVVPFIPGTKKTVIYDLSGKFPPGVTDYKVRMRGFVRTWIDYVGVDTSPDAEMHTTEIQASKADLSFVGGGGRVMENGYPIFQWTPSGEQFPHAGNFTAYGDVKPLLSDVDDRFVVMDNGDAISLEFPEADPPAAGMDRTYVLSTDGYFKEGATATVDPMPFHAMSNFPYGADEHYPTDSFHQQYLTDYNTRVVTPDALSTTNSARVPAPAATTNSARVPAPAATAMAASVVAPAKGSASASVAAAKVAVASTVVDRVHPVSGMAKALAMPWFQVHGPRGMVVGVSKAPRIKTKKKIHYSVNTDSSKLTVEYYNDSVATVQADAGWYSTSATPTPSAPGSVSATAVAAMAAQDGQYWITDGASGEGAYNWQLMQFDAPGSPNLLTARSLRLNWIGHGEPTPNHPTVLYAWNFNTSKWDQVSSGSYGTDTSVSTFTDATDGGSGCLRCHDGSLPSGVVMPSGTTTISPIWTNNSSGDFHGPRPGPSNAAALTPLAFPYSYGQSAGIACETCHDAHGSANLYHIPTTVNNVTGVSVTDSASMQNLCATCHTGAATDWHSTCNDCHESYDAQDGHGGFGWVGSDYNDCLVCHSHGKVFVHVGESGCHGCTPSGAQWRSF